MDLAVIRKQTRLGRTLGNRGFLEMLSKKLGTSQTLGLKVDLKRDVSLNIPKYPLNILG